jgi:hypothetical protein
VGEDRIRGSVSNKWIQVILKKLVGYKTSGNGTCHSYSLRHKPRSVEKETWIRTWNKELKKN